MLPAYRMAQMVYHRLLEDTARLQQEVVMQNMVNASFGPDALPVNEILRGREATLARHREEPTHRITTVNKLIEANIKLIEEFEKLFEENQASDIEAFAAAMAGPLEASDAQ